MHSAELRQDLSAILAAKGPDYTPRTEHLDSVGRPIYTNRLIREDSPYLLQHAHNPVDWYPWGEEAFARASLEGKAVFLSIGYSTCHWCHVMERESFENEAIAEVLNRDFICIKVDREQRPDVDEVYMTAVQLQTGHGGWPMSSFLTPDRDPFFGGTYFPPERFSELLVAVGTAWRDRREELMTRASDVTKAVRSVLSTRQAAGEIGADVVAAAVGAILERSDPTFGGPRGAPKFPHESDLLLLADDLARRQDSVALGALGLHLDGIARGGIHDQVGGGFHRYSVDERWLVPHFEKMLYNQALLARAFLAGNAVTGDRLLERAARTTLDYVLLEMQAPEGGFYSATDADSEGEEGLFFVWTKDELIDILGAEDGAIAGRLWGVEDGGNFEGRSILYQPHSFVSVAEDLGVSLEGLLARVDGMRERLREAREGRPHPLRDDKRLLAWNGMMVTALADGGAGLAEPRYVAEAVRAAEFAWREMRRSTGRFWRIWLGGKASTPALQEDHANLAEGLLALYDATADRLWLDRAIETVDGMIEQFWDAESGGFFSSSEELAPYLIAQPRSSHDGATPSGNSVALRVLSRLANRSGVRDYRDRADALVAGFAGAVSQRPAAHSYFLLALNELREGQVGATLFGAGGRLRAEGAEVPPTESMAGADSRHLRIVLTIADGWHVNSATPHQEELIATTVEVSSEWQGRWTPLEVSMPVGSDVNLSFDEDPVSVYQGRAVIDVIIRPLAVVQALVPLRLRFQACDDRRCLSPEVLELRLPIAP